MKKLLILIFLTLPFFANSQTPVFQTLREVGTDAMADRAQMTTITVTSGQITLNGAIFNVVSTVQGSIGQNKVLKTETGGEFVLLFDGEELTTVIHNPTPGEGVKYIYCEPLQVGKKI